MYQLTCADIQFIVEELGYYVEGDEDSALSQWKVYPN